MPKIGQIKPVHAEEPSYFSRQIRASKRFYNPALTHDETSDPRFSVHAGGWESCARGYSIARDVFPYYSLEFVVSGHGKVVLGNTEHQLIPGVFFSYGPNIPHTIINDSNIPLEKYFVCVLASDREAVFGDDTEIYGQVLHSVRPLAIQQTFEELTNYGLENNVWSNKICAHLVQLMVLKMAESSIGNDDFSGIAYTNYLRCLSVINQNHLQFKNLNEIAEACYTDTSYLCKLFKKFNHQSPYQYFLRLNMNHAADLLLQRSYQIQEVAEIMSYTDPLHFSRTFKKVMGIAPSEFIKLSSGKNQLKTGLIQA